MLLREKFVAFLEAFLAFGGRERFDARPTGVEYGSGGHAEADEVVAILTGKDEVVLAAVETAAEQRAAMVDCATLRTEIDAGAVLAGGEDIEGFTSVLIGEDKMPVGLHIVPLFGMQQ